MACLQIQSALRWALLIVLFRNVFVNGQLDLPSSPEVRGLRPKYFREMDINPEERQVPVSDEPFGRARAHFDGRFMQGWISSSQRQQKLLLLTESYFSVMADLKLTTWIQHGTLLGWYRNQKMLPWDTDVDVQIDEASLGFLANYYNMTVHTFEGESEDDMERSYLLEINPNYDDAGTEDGNNVIDARWIDMDTGLFLDITAVRRYHDPTLGRVILRCKDSNEYEETDLYPLLKSTLNDIPVVVPSRPEKILSEKYGEDSLTQVAWEGFSWNSREKEWTWRPRSPAHALSDARRGGQALRASE